MHLCGNIVRERAGSLHACSEMLLSLLFGVIGGKPQVSRPILSNSMPIDRREHGVGTIIVRIQRDGLLEIADRYCKILA